MSGRGRKGGSEGDGGWLVVVERGVVDMKSSEVKSKGGSENIDTVRLKPKV